MGQWKEGGEWRDDDDVYVLEKKGKRSNVVGVDEVDGNKHMQSSTIRLHFVFVSEEHKKRVSLLLSYDSTLHREALKGKKWN